MDPDCLHKFEQIQPNDYDNPECPICRGEVRRLISAPADYKGGGFSTRYKAPALVPGESGKLGQKVSETDEKDFEKGVRADSRGRPKMTPTRPAPPHRK